MSEEQAAQDKPSGSSKPTTTTASTNNNDNNNNTIASSSSTSAAAAATAQKNKEELIIEQVRTELETYFAPQNIQNDFNLRQKMTTDGYIDIDLLLDLKLISDLARSDREILIEAISRSKCLVMNTGCTMVHYMPLLERKWLILRDIATSTEKKAVLAIFDNEHCDKPQEVHSDIGNNWFCQFKTEDECLNTAKYLQQSGTFNGERLHVRVKAIHDKNKADTSPTMQQPNIAKKNKPLSPQQYSAVPPPGYYGAAPPPPPYAAAYYGAPPIGVDPYAYAAAQYVTAPPPMAVGAAVAGGKPRTRDRDDRRDRDRSSKKRSSKPRDEDIGRAVNGQQRRQRQEQQQAMELTPPAVDGALIAGTYEATAAVAALEDERTPTSDYPGKFDKYTQEQFVAIYQAMKAKALQIPQSMRGRDSRIISERLQTPIALNPEEDDHGDADSKELEAESGQTATARGKKNGAVAGGGKGGPKRRKKRKQQFQHEVHGTYYEDQVYAYAGYAQAQAYDVAPTATGGGGAAVDAAYGAGRGGGGGYYDEAYDNGDSYYYEEYAAPPKQAPRANRRRNRRGDTGGATGGGGGGGNAGYGYYDTGYYDSGYYQQSGGGGGQSRRDRGSVGRQYKSKRSPNDYNATSTAEWTATSTNRPRTRWSQKQAKAPAKVTKHYSTSKGVYRPKQAAN
eukprot:CAMPEP_0202686744 /NCGR_PEP_ID=MMETSP1385-20130828/2507_1 /ASSEMBLY_ACC=CAM_ASM_000861 /TAXON_ID=933848 /ORGANISM="Elphidium margaritaceum" /LENGTH=676 /DNA_ID=CAMNT_0049341391 /DNA_START=137 /DNA_END=2167 /DNA_ORIENTATION=-